MKRMELFHGIPWKMSQSSMENVDAEISMEFHGNWCPNVFHGIPWEMS